MPPPNASTRSLLANPGAGAPRPLVSSSPRLLDGVRQGGRTACTVAGRRSARLCQHVGGVPPWSNDTKFKAVHT